MGLGSRKKIASQHPAPPAIATQSVSAWPVCASTLNKACTAPMQNGSKQMARMVLTHLGMGVFSNLSRFRQRPCYMALVYLDFYGLKEPPSNITPSPRYLFYGAKHREALNYLLYG